jgi:hypothetical protein
MTQAQILNMKNCGKVTCDELVIFNNTLQDLLLARKDEYNEVYTTEQESLSVFNMDKPYTSFLNWINNIKIRVPAHRKIFFARYGLLGNDPVLLEQLANEFGVTKQNISLCLHKFHKKTVKKSYEIDILVQYIAKYYEDFKGDIVNAIIKAFQPEAHMIKNVNAIIYILSFLQTWRNANLPCLNKYTINSTFTPN